MAKGATRTSPRKSVAKKVARQGTRKSPRGKGKASRSPPEKKVKKPAVSSRSPKKKIGVNVETPEENAKNVPAAGGADKRKASTSLSEREASGEEENRVVESDSETTEVHEEEEEEAKTTEVQNGSDEEGEEEVEATNPYEIDFEGLFELDEEGCVEMWKWFAFEKEKRRRYFITNEDGEQKQVFRGSTKRMLMLGAAMVVHFFWYGRCEKKLSYTKQKLAGLIGVYNNEYHVEKTHELINMMNEAHRFLDEGVDPYVFVKSFDFGQTYQYFKGRFKQPKGNPVGWWEDNHVFPDKNPYGLHVVWKQFFDCVGHSFE